MSHWLSVLPELARATGTTLATACLATVCTVVLGLVCGVLMVATDKDGPLPVRALHAVLAGLVEIVGSVPVVILVLAALPLIRGSAERPAGLALTVVPLVIAATPWFARRVESSLRAVTPEVVEVAVAMGARARHVLVTVLLREGLPRIVSGVALTAVLVLGFTAIVDVLDRRGLGGMALAYGIEQPRADVVVVIAGVFVIVAQVVKWLGGLAAQRLDHRR
jgi:D-methionine transport system permease protein